jgi:hypothetical protein
MKPKLYDGEDNLTKGKPEEQIQANGRIISIHYYNKVNPNEPEVNQEFMKSINQKFCKHVEDYFATRDRLLGYYNNGRRLTDFELVESRKQEDKNKIPYSYELLPEGGYRVTPFPTPKPKE